MTNPYFSPSGNPATGSEGLSSIMRTEFANISAGFDLLPAFTGNGGKVVVINPGGTALDVLTGTLTIPGLAVTSNVTVGGALGVTGAVSGAGFVARFSSPGPVGNTAPSTGAFTTLSASGATDAIGTITIHAPMASAVPGLAALAINMPASYAKFGWLNIDANNIGSITWTSQTRNVGGTIPISVAGAVPVAFTATGSITAPATTGAKATPTLFAFSTSDSLNASATNGFAMALFSHNYGGGSAAGGHSTIGIDTNFNTAAVGNGTFLSSINLGFRQSAAFTGTAGNVVVIGGFYSGAAGATNLGLVEYIEASVGSLAPITSVRGGICMFSDGAYNGPSDDFAYNVSRTSGSVGFVSAFQVGRGNVPWPTTTTGALFEAKGQTNGLLWINQVSGYGIKIDTVNYATAAFRSSGFLVDPNGQTFVGPGHLTPTATGLGIDVGDYEGNTPTVNVAGAAYAGTDQLTDAYGGIYGVTVNGDGNITAFNIIRKPYSYGGAGPATVTLRGGSSTTQAAAAAVANLTWTQRTRLDIGNTNALTINIGANATTGITVGGASAKLAFFAGTPAVKPTGVAVTAAGIHAALTTLGLIAP